MAFFFRADSYFRILELYGAIMGVVFFGQNHSVCTARKKRTVNVLIFPVKWFTAAAVAAVRTAASQQQQYSSLPIQEQCIAAGTATARVARVVLYCCSGRGLNLVLDTNTNVVLASAVLSLTQDCVARSMELSRWKSAWR